MQLELVPASKLVLAVGREWFGTSDSRWEADFAGLGAQPGRTALLTSPGVRFSQHQAILRLQLGILRLRSLLTASTQR